MGVFVDLDCGPWKRKDSDVINTQFSSGSRIKNRKQIDKIAASSGSGALP